MSVSLGESDSESSLCRSELATLIPMPHEPHKDHNLHNRFTLRISCSAPRVEFA